MVKNKGFFNIGGNNLHHIDGKEPDNASGTTPSRLPNYST